MSNAFERELDNVGRLALSAWNRDPGSPSYGCFDRQYWGWKYKDFADATLQYGVRLAVEYLCRQGAQDLLPELLDAFITYVGNIQHNNGSFDQCYPNERTPGVVLDFLSVLIYLHQHPATQLCQQREQLERIIARAAEFTLRTEEDHGDVANHFIQYADELDNYAQFSGDQRARQRADHYMTRALELFNHEEGWFREYNGADAGYQSRSLRFLVQLAVRRGDDSLLDTGVKACSFLQQVLMPDGSVHPMLGVRSTALLYAGGTFLLARHRPQVQNLAARIYLGWQQSCVPLPSALDTCNAFRLGDDCLLAAANLPPPDSQAFAHADLASSVDLPQAGIHIKRQTSSCIYVHRKLGGVVVAYSLDNNQQWRLRFESAGYTATEPHTKTCWISRYPIAEAVVDAGDNNTGFAQTVTFSRSLHEELTPFKMLVLRTLNLTVLRNQWIADLFRRIVARRLFGEPPASGISLVRKLIISEEHMQINDQIRSTDLNASVIHHRRCSAAHMASSRYFQDGELQLTEQAWSATLGTVSPQQDLKHTFSVDFRDIAS